MSTAEYAVQSTAIALLLVEVVLSRAPLVSYHLQVTHGCSTFFCTCMWQDVSGEAVTMLNAALM